MYSSSSSSKFFVIVAMANGLCGAAYARSSSISSLHWQYAVDTCVNTFNWIISMTNFRIRCVPSVFIFTAPANVWSKRTFAAQWNTTLVSLISRLRSDSLMPKPSIEISPLITMIFFNCCGFAARMRSKIYTETWTKPNNYRNVKVFYSMRCNGTVHLPYYLHNHRVVVQVQCHALYASVDSTFRCPDSHVTISRPTLCP